MGLIEQLREDFQFYRDISPQLSFVAVMLDRRFLVCVNYRFGYWACRLGVPLAGRVMRIFYVVSNFITSVITGAEIRSGAIIGRRFQVHTTFGILITNGVILGDDCTVNTGACVVNKANNRGEGQPRIGNNVTLGAGCKVMGGITIGDNVIVGANAVVIHDVPANHMAVGVPARNIMKRATTQELRTIESQIASVI
jgi:serine O-acetyltransferase